MSPTQLGVDSFTFLTPILSKKMASRDNESIVAASIAAMDSVQGAWEFLRNYEPEEGKGFMFSLLPPKGQEVQEALMDVHSGHSGASLASLLRHLQAIARSNVKNDADPPSVLPSEKPAEKALSASAREQFLALGTNMTLHEQIHQLEKHMNTPMTYLEMRQRFG